MDNPGLSRWAPNAITGVPVREVVWGEIDKHTWEERRPQTRVLRPQLRDASSPQQLERAGHGFSVQPPGGSKVVLTPAF